MQCAIDNSKRTFDINITDEIKRIKKDMDMSQYKYPTFWKSIKRGFNKNNINEELVCPMNYLCNLEFSKNRSPYSTIPVSEFFVKSGDKPYMRRCKQVEDLIEKYALDVYRIADSKDEGGWLLLRGDFSYMISEIQKMNISKNYAGLFSWLIDRAFSMTPEMKYNANSIQSSLQKNRATLIRVLYEINPKLLLQCFSNKPKI